MTNTKLDKKPIVIGLYGISGCGKTHLHNQLEQMLPREQYLFFEGSEVLSNLVLGGLDVFKQLPKAEQTSYREQAIQNIGQECAAKNCVGVVTGHFMFWNKTSQHGGGWGEEVITPADLSTYTHIIYLNIPLDTVAHYRREDAERRRGELIGFDELRKWQDMEKQHLRRICAEHGILFSLVRDGNESPIKDRVLTLLEDFRTHNIDVNSARAIAKMDEAILPKSNQLTTVLLMDGDRTLLDKDTGCLFWELVCRARATCGLTGLPTVKDVFGGPLGYSYTAFRQAMLLYEEVAAELVFDQLCANLLGDVEMDDRMVTLLRRAVNKPHVAAVVVTCGLGRLWEMIVAKAGLSETVKVIGGGRISDGFVVTAEVKAALVDHLHSVYSVRVSALGDSPLDLPMLTKADDAVVVVCPEDTRSKTMDAALLAAINDDFHPRQMLLPTMSESRPRLDTLTLPLVHLDDDDTVERFLLSRGRDRLFHATDRPSAKLLMTSTRDAFVSGPTLREAHFRIGQYLATEFVTKVVGLEAYPIPHVQGHTTTGHRLRNEAGTIIVALMRGGEPMAFGVSAAFPTASFLHAKNADELKPEHVQGRRNVILVDSVINSGKSIVEFLERLAALEADFDRIVVVAGVVQSGALSEDGVLGRALARDCSLSVVALRLSDNKFTGKGTTDTGNRLFNTTHLD